MTGLNLDEVVNAERARRAAGRRTVVARYPSDPVYIELIESEFAAARERSANVRRASDVAIITLAREGRANMEPLMSALMGEPGWLANFNDDVDRRFQAKRRQRSAQSHGEKIRAAWKEATGARFAVVGRVLARWAAEPARPQPTNVWPHPSPVA
jgi:hypothetical protein